MVEICGRNSDEMFYLSRDGDIEITFLGFINAHLTRNGLYGLYWYARQSICASSKEELDEFGRNHTDRTFILLCDAVFNIAGCDDKNTSFKSLSCKKQGEQYIARLELTDETLEMEMSEMIPVLHRRFMEMN